MATILIRNGKIIDGSGNPAFEGSLLLRDNRIEAVIERGEVLPEADRIIEAEGLAVAPGFIDMHSHADWVLPLDRNAEILKCLVEQGITTVVGGNCGFSPAPVVPEKKHLIDAPAAMLVDEPLAYDWRTMDEFLNRVVDAKPIVNLAELVGHAAVRYCNTDTLRGPMTPEELARCLDDERKAFDDGACGLSFGLGYDPGMYSPTEELDAFCAVAAKAGVPVTVHLKAQSVVSPCYVNEPSDTPHNERALTEMLDVARRTGCRLQLSHFIFVGRSTWGTADRCIQLVEEARQEGVDVMIDAFPVTCGNTTILAPFPYWFLSEYPAAFENEEMQRRLEPELDFGFAFVGFTYSDFQVMDAAVPGWEDLNGLRITDIAQKWQCTPFAAMFKLAAASLGATLMLFHAYSGEPGNEEVLEKVLSCDYCLFETDAAIKSTGYPNPAALGAFPRVLGEFVRNRKLFSLENAVKRMTSESAKRFGLKDIGLIKPGMAADVVVFNPETILDTPFLDMQAAVKPAGIEHVFINGRHAVINGDYVKGIQAGRVLR
ncbi:MAG: amidohydrolase family protein [Deltaproteobacteria bacterium]|nr:amidohydrolase family protein [Deltaproteobacteria bacterium]